MTDAPIKSIGLIMDGNRRWAKARGMKPWEGHRAGFDALANLEKEFPRLRDAYGTRYATIYAFSTENWNRDTVEVEFLMQIFETELGVRLDAPQAALAYRFIGQRERFSAKLQSLMKGLEEKKTDTDAVTVTFALSYGGRAEIVAAANDLIAKGKSVTEEGFAAALWTQGIPDPDLVIRTSGEMRLSNFLPWEAVYSELFFVEKHWPDFTVADLESVFAEFRERDRRHGK